MEYYENVINNLEKLLANDSQEDIDAKRKAGQFEYIPFRVCDFITQITAARKMLKGPNYETNYKFIDVGCGIGTKVLLAREYFDAYGIEITNKYVERARALLIASKSSRWSKPNVAELCAKIIEGDALEHDYREYDVVYFYWPIRHSETQVKLEQHIIRTIKKGGIVIANGFQGGRKLWETVPMQRLYGDNIFVKAWA